jgi:hypothetical protein
VRDDGGKEGGKKKERERGMLRGRRGGRRKRDYRALSFCIPCCTKCWSNGTEIRGTERNKDSMMS